MSTPTASVALCYHRIGRPAHDPFGLAITPEQFAEQVAVIARHRPLALGALAAQAAAGDVPPGSVAVSFDDGYRDNLVNAVPVLERAGVPATIFVTTGLTGSRRLPWWEELDHLLLGSPWPRPELAVRCGSDARTFVARDRAQERGEGYALWAWLRPRPHAEIEEALQAVRAWRGRSAPLAAGDDERVLGADELRQLAASALVELGAHTRTHPVLAARAPAEQRGEVGGSRSDLEAVIGAPVRGFAYPFGKRRAEYDAATVRAVEAAGFSWAWTTMPRPVTRRSRVLELPRHVPPQAGGEAFAAWLSERLNPPAAHGRALAGLRPRMRRHRG